MKGAYNCVKGQNESFNRLRLYKNNRRISSGGNGGFFMKLHFGPWPDECHETIDQIKRIYAGKKIPATKVNVDPESQHAVIEGAGSEPYCATLDSCTCPDFSIHHGKVPCKHIYRLADELGLLSDLPEFNKAAAKQFDSSTEIERFREMWESGIISGDCFIKVAEALSKSK